MDTPERIFQQLLPCTEFLLQGVSLEELQRAKWRRWARTRDKRHLREYMRGYMHRWKARQGDAWRAKHAADMRRWREERRANA